MWSQRTEVCLIQISSARNVTQCKVAEDYKVNASWKLANWILINVTRSDIAKQHCK